MASFHIMQKQTDEVLCFQRRAWVFSVAIELVRSSEKTDSTIADAFDRKDSILWLLRQAKHHVSKLS